MYQVRLRDGGVNKEAPLDLAAMRARCPEHVAGAAFYAATGNDYHGEFRALRDGWGGGGGGGGGGGSGGGETLGLIEYPTAEAQHLHLRSCAWLDVASHAMVWWMGHLGRGFYAAAVREYRVLRHRVIDNRQLWSVRTAGAADGGGSAANGAISTLQIYDAAFAPVVRVEGSRAGRFDCDALCMHCAVYKSYMHCMCTCTCTCTLVHVHVHVHVHIVCPLRTHTTAQRLL